MCSRPVRLQAKNLSQNKIKQTSLTSDPLTLILTLKTHLSGVKALVMSSRFSKHFPKSRAFLQSPKGAVMGHLCSSNPTFAQLALPSPMPFPQSSLVSTLPTSNATCRRATHQRCTCPLTMHLPWLFAKSKLYLYRLPGTASP